MASPLPPPPPPPPAPAPGWEFSKRKKWPELLVAELADTLVLVLSPHGTIWYCGPAVSDVLGWHDQDLLDEPLDAYIRDTDIPLFRALLATAFASNTDLSLFTHLKCPPLHPAVRGHQAPHDAPPAPPDPPALPRDVLVELRGHCVNLASLADTCPPDPELSPDASPNTDPPVRLNCMIVMAKPYPSPNTSMLSDFLRLKLENEYLNQRLVDLRTALHTSVHATANSLSSLYPNSLPSAPGTSINSPPSPSFPSAGRTAFRFGTSPMGNGSSPHTASSSGPGYANAPYAPSTGTTVGASDPTTIGGSAGAPDMEDASGRRKKAKKASAMGEHVCAKCGRTDSPEWRKGPLGPKTLCNACGLRWAKTAREKTTEANAAAAAAVAANTPGASSDPSPSSATTDAGVGPPPSMGPPPVPMRVAQQVQIPAGTYPHLVGTVFPPQIQPTPVARVMDLSQTRNGGQQHPHQ